MLRRELQRRAVGAAKHDRDRNLAARLVQDLRRGLLQQATAHLVSALVDADFLTHEEHVGVALHLLAQRLVEGVAVRERRHQSANTWVVSSAGSGSGL